ncbi:MAG: tetratricopeptide repeat protein [Phycisphaerae bacterium]
MPRWSSRSNACLVWLLLVAGLPGEAVGKPRPAVTPHPQLVLRSVSGDEVISIDAYRGSKVLLIHLAPWSPASWEALALWTEKTRHLVEDKQLVVLGVMLERRRDRARLFAQWKQLDLPLLFDPLNLAGVAQVPTVVGIDEQGFTRVVDPKPEEFEKRFVRRKFKVNKLALRAPILELPDPKYTRRMAGEARSAAGWRAHGDALVLAGKPVQLEEALRTYRDAITMNPKDWLAFYRLGVAHMIRFDRPEHQPGDFQAAIDAWRSAARLCRKGNIPRAPIEQFGLREEKPGSMYGWIKTARKAIKARGETPVALDAEPASIESAKPRKKFRSSRKKPAPESGSPDAAAEDTRSLVEVETAIVRGLSSKHRSIVQVVLIFRPAGGRGAQWDNTGPPLRVRIDPPEGVKVDRRLLTAANPAETASAEPRMVNVEVKRSKKARKQTITLKARAFYRVTATGGDAQSLYRDFEVSIPPK